jgi:hypothetical protein
VKTARRSFSEGGRPPSSYDWQAIFAALQLRLASQYFAADSQNTRTDASLIVIARSEATKQFSVQITELLRSTSWSSQ